MSLTIAIQACCQVFQISLADLLNNDKELHNSSLFVTERKFAAYYCFGLDTRRQVCKYLNMSDTTLSWYKDCISELIEEDHRHCAIINAIDDKYKEIQAQRMQSEKILKP